MWREGLRFTCPFSQPRRCDLTRHTLTLYLLLLLPIVSASVREVIIFPDKTDDGETCRPLGGGDGECLDLFLLPSVVSTFKKVHPALCGFRDMEQPRPTSPYPTQPLPPPAVDVKCGLGGSSKKKRPPKLAGLIGGVEAKPNSWPWVAAVGSIERGGKVNWFCDGVLITPQFVLTAGHCVWYFEVDLVRLGGHNLTTRRPAQVDVRVSVTTLHPLYSPPSLAHDLAILRLDHPVKLSSQVSPVCLPWTVKDSPDLEGRSFTLVGWGATRFGGAGSDVLGGGRDGVPAQSL
ncbi:clotting factor B-like isoform X2 [Homarus americanus]|uniref:clotting factor B-like isoform X2 n=1 Tax=Homarus americanus TaxID=6706 RepID=UPI001C4604C8|nr:clotting factor B-like isoform X2 [Homarus americanus]